MYPNAWLPQQPILHHCPHPHCFYPYWSSTTWFFCCCWCFINVLLRWVFICVCYVLFKCGDAVAVFGAQDKFPCGDNKVYLILLLQTDFWCTHVTIINAFWNKYRFVSPSSKNRTKVNLKHMHKGYYTACQCWSIVPVTPNMHPIGFVSYAWRSDLLVSELLFFIKVH